MTTMTLDTEVETIIETKERMLKRRQERTGVPAMISLAVMKSLENRPIPFLNTVTNRGHGEIQVIGQIRLAKTYDPVGTALRYLRTGLDSVSLFTDERVYSKGLEDLLILSRAIQHQPVISQDIVLNEFHVAEVRAAGASSMLIYASILDHNTLRRVASITHRWQMTVMIQVSNREQMEAAIDQSPHLICIGHGMRFDPELDLPLMEELAPLIPYHIKMMPLGTMSNLQDIESILEFGIDAVIVDENLGMNAQRYEKLLTLLKRL